MFFFVSFILSIYFLYRRPLTVMLFKLTLSIIFPMHTNYIVTARKKKNKHTHTYNHPLSLPLSLTHANILPRCVSRSGRKSQVVGIANLLYSYHEIRIISHNIRFICKHFVKLLCSFLLYLPLSRFLVLMINARDLHTSYFLFVHNIYDYHFPSQACISMNNVHISCACVLPAKPNQTKKILCTLCTYFTMLIFSLFFLIKPVHWFVYLNISLILHTDYSIPVDSHEQNEILHFLCHFTNILEQLIRWRREWRRETQKMFFIHA